MGVWQDIKNRYWWQSFLDFSEVFLMSACIQNTVFVLSTIVSLVFLGVYVIEFPIYRSSCPFSN